MTGTYSPRNDGRLSPGAQHSCPSEGEGGKTCNIFVKEWRRRKAGLGHDLLVCKCVTHACCFTVYPIGWWPYSRVGVGDAAPNLFDAANEAANGQLWPKDGRGLHDCRKTQHRRVTLSLKLLGIDPGMSPMDRLSAARELGIATVKLIDLAGRARAGPTLSGRALLVIETAKVRPTSNVIPLLARGFTIGRWPAPLVTNRG